MLTRRMPFLGEDSRSEYVRCRSCKVEHITSHAWICEDCFQKLVNADEGRKGEIQNLEAKNLFLRSWIPTDQDHPSGGSHGHGSGFADVTLVADEDVSDGVPLRQVPAHRFILASRSPVFKSMFETQMAESQSGIIKINEVSYDALQVFVKYLYTAEACLEEQLAWELLVLAEKYQVMHLKGYCEKFMVLNLTWENCVTSYIAAHQQGTKLLLAATLSLMLDDILKLDEHPDYSELYESHKSLLLDIHLAFAAKLKNITASVDTTEQHLGE